MRTSTERILTTHVGSLPRPDALIELLRAKEAGAPYDEAAFAEAVRAAVAEIVRRQVETGIDVVDDGEESKVSFVAYVNDRLGGFEARGLRPNPFGTSREHRAYPEFYRAAGEAPGGTATTGIRHMVCTGPITYVGRRQLETDVANLKAALQGNAVAEAFMPSTSPANVERWQSNEHYPSQDEYLAAIAEAMRVEYEAIVAAGFVVQIDDPSLATHYTRHPELSVEECLAWGETRIEALNHALRNIPEDRIRYHTCYGINMGPRTTDLELRYLAPLLVKIRAGAYSFEAANPRHDHEWRVWEETSLPDGKVLIPGVITHTSVLVEHPELVADRIVRYAEIVGRERVIAGGDCGFATHPSATPEIHPTIAWAKLAALVEGARLASARLWKKAA